jgi:hypothetical protein
MLIYWAEAYILLKKNANTLVVAGKVTGLKVNSNKTRYPVMSRDQNAGRSHNIEIDNRAFARVEQLKYLEKNL